ncbi:MAG: eutC [Chitinophagaceae bacterium]|nr:eutC [Chitinophagaceae bacterium]
MAKDLWHLLKQYTNARIAMGRAGTSLPTQDILQFRMAHSLAKDAIYSEINTAGLESGLKKLELSSITVKSQVADRNDYLRNPDKGRALHASSQTALEALSRKPVDVCLIIADGLSANAVNIHAVPVLELLLPQIANMTLSPVVIAHNSRVALSDPIGELLHARIAIILIGERPGLSSPNSMGAYLTYQPTSGNTDEKRNCVSNIQPEGLTYQASAIKLSYLLNQMLVKQISGVQLKDDHSDTSLLQ